MGLALKAGVGLTAGVLAAIFVSAGGTQAATPDFFSGGIGWVTDSNDFIVPASGPGPVTFDPAHPYVPNGTGGQPTFRVADITNPILMPWVRDALKKINADVLAGKTGYTRANACWPAGVPAILAIRRTPTYFVQTPKQIWLITQNDHQVRRVYMNVSHSANPKPSWYGESIGRYDGAALVVDTIGITTKTTVDNYSVPHTDKLHVVERYRMNDSGKTMQVDLTVDDKGAFTVPWHAIQHYRQVQEGPMIEEACAESNPTYLGDAAPIPTADKPDF